MIFFSFNYTIQYKWFIQSLIQYKDNLASFTRFCQVYLISSLQISSFCVNCPITLYRLFLHNISYVSLISLLFDFFSPNLIIPNLKKLITTTTYKFCSYNPLSTTHYVSITPGIGIWWNESSGNLLHHVEIFRVRSR